MVRITLDKPYIPIPVPVTVKYGLLYNWYAATDVRLICADGWEVPEKTDFDTLIAYVGGGEFAGNKLKEIGTTYFDEPITISTNEYGFNGRGAGFRGLTGSFIDFRISSAFISKTLVDDNYYSMGILNEYESAENGYGSKDTGFSIRPIKTTTTLTHGQTGTYTGNDGKVYRTICIGTQEWLADNLCETKYRNGDTIPEVTDNSAWAALTTGALCAYNNDWSNVLI